MTCSDCAHMRELAERFTEVLHTYLAAWEFKPESKKALLDYIAEIETEKKKLGGAQTTLDGGRQVTHVPSPDRKRWSA